MAAATRPSTGGMICAPSRHVELQAVVAGGLWLAVHHDRRRRSRGRGSRTPRPGWAAGRGPSHGGSRARRAPPPVPAKCAERWRASCATTTPASAAPGTSASRYAGDARGRLAHHDAVHAGRARGHRAAQARGAERRGARRSGRPAPRRRRRRAVAASSSGSRGRGRARSRPRPAPAQAGESRRHGRPRPPRAAVPPARSTEALPVASTSRWSSASPDMPGARCW